MDLLITARSFKEILTINVDQHKILNNFCYMMINSEECRSYHTGHVFKTMIKHSSLSTQLPEFKGIIRTYVLMINQSSI